MSYRSCPLQNSFIDMKLTDNKLHNWSIQFDNLWHIYLYIHENITVMKIINIHITPKSFLPHATCLPFPTLHLFPRQLLICFLSLYIHLNYPKFYINGITQYVFFVCLPFFTEYKFWDSSLLLSVSMIHSFSLKPHPQLFKGIIYIQKCHPFSVYSSMNFGNFTEYCHHHHNPVQEFFHHPRETLCHLQSLLSK